MLANFLFRAISVVLVVAVFCETGKCVQSTQSSRAPQQTQGKAASAKLSDVFESWRDRTKRIKSLRISWTQEMRTSAKARSIKIARSARTGGKSDGLAPIRDTVLNWTCELLVKSGKMAVIADQEILFGSSMKPTTRTRKAAYNGTENRLLDKIAIFGHHNGVIGEHSHIDEVNQSAFKPLLWTVCPIPSGGDSIEPYHEFSLSLFQTGLKTGFVREQQCHILSINRKTDILRLWVDPARDHIILRSTIESGGLVRKRTDVDYAKVSGVWIPSKWEVHSLSRDGASDRVISASVTHCDLNQPIADSEFDIEFPTGTVVADLRNHENYILREGGAKQFLTPGDAGLSYDEIIARNMNIEREKSLRRSWLFLANVAAFALLLGYWGWRKVYQNTT